MTGATLVERLHARAAQTPDGRAYSFLDAQGQWRSLSWGDVSTQVRTLSAALASHGLKRGDRVALMMPTIPEWEICSYAALGIGAIVVGLDSHDAPSNIRHILETCQPAALIAYSPEQLTLLRQVWKGPALEILKVASEADADTLTLRDLLTQSSGAHSTPLPEPGDDATIIFTSGSTGLPKGIAYTHAQVVLACDAILAVFPSMGAETRLVCWLPLSNLFQRMINACAMSLAAHTHFVDRPERIIELLPSIEPTLFIGVPRFFEKLHAGIQTRIAQQAPIARNLANLAWHVGVLAARSQRNGTPAPLWVRLLHPLADRVLARIRAIMGHRLQFMVSGSAPLPPWLMARFHGLGWLILEAYGISENILPNAINQLDQYRFGSVGRALPPNEIKLADDTELLVRGPGVFAGYYGETNQGSPIDAAGYLHTGDFARIDDDGFVWIEGRKSEIFKTSTGRRIAPAPIEASLKQLDFVDHAMVIGHNRLYPIAVITIKPDHKWLSHDAPTLKALIGPAVSSVCAELGEHQRPGAIVVSRKPLTIAAGELTSNLKLRRKSIEARFAAEIDTAYQAVQSSLTQTRAPIIRVIEAQ